jgi:hypothetical protein
MNMTSTGKGVAMDTSERLDERNQEIVDALKAGAVVTFSHSGDVTIGTVDDFSPSARECYRASMEHDLGHQAQCADRLEDEIYNTLMDAESHRADGHVQDANILEVEAAELRLRAARLTAAAK